MRILVHLLRAASRPFLLVFGGSSSATTLGRLVTSLLVGAVIGLILAVVVVVASRQDFSYSLLSWFQSSRTQDKFGKILVESPEVYTRERLVNDRLRQTVWLEKQMQATDQVIKRGEFHSVEGDWRKDLQSETKISVSANRRTEGARSVNIPDGIATSMRTPAMHETNRDDPSLSRHREGPTIELFRAMNDYREQVRTELMQTQLDDRHDIDGNTLYRLNFNTTIIHGRESDTLGVISVRLQHTDSIDDFGISYYGDLLRDWSRELEARLNQAAESRLPLLLEPGTKDRDATEFYRWLRWRICKKLTAIAALPGYASIGSGLAVSSTAGHNKPPPETIGAISLFKSGKCGDKYYSILESGSANDDGQETLEGRLDWFINDYSVRFIDGKSAQDKFAKYLVARKRLFEQYVDSQNGNDNQLTSAYQDPLEYYDDLQRRWCPSTSPASPDQPATQGPTSGANNDPEATQPQTSYMGAHIKDSRRSTNSQTESGEQAAPEPTLKQLLCSREKFIPAAILPITALTDLYWRLEQLQKALTDGIARNTVSLFKKDLFDDVRKLPGAKRRLFDDVNELLDEVASHKTRLDMIGCREAALDRAAKLLRGNVTSEPTLLLDAELAAVIELLDVREGLVCMADAQPPIWLRSLTFEQEVDQFYRDFIDSNTRLSGGTGLLANIVTVQAEGCEALLCRISVKPAAASQSVADGHSGGIERAISCFHERLEGNFEAFSYGVTPKTLHQRLIFGQATARNMALALETPSLAGTEATGLLERALREDENIRSVLSRPVVIGFGRGRTHHERSDQLNEKCGSDDDYSRDAQPAGAGIKSEDADEVVDLSRGTDFGWIIAPEKRWEESGGNWHPHRQYDLSAVLSIPSWWRRVKLSVVTCWRTLSNIEEFGDENFARCDQMLDDTGNPSQQGRSEYTYAIKLPGDIGEVSRKFRMRVREVPYILDTMFRDKPYLFDVGKRADIVIEGGRLWRGTRVTLGTQSADEIIVLPHMQGIIATFNCVRRPPYWQAPRGEELQNNGGNATAAANSESRLWKTKVQVWTSEGVTASPLPVYVVENKPSTLDVCRQDNLTNVAY